MGLGISVRRGGYFELDTFQGTIRIHISRSSESAVRLTIDAPASVGILRDEVLEKIEVMRHGHLPEQVAQLASTSDD
jgi:sRNA-binding carbon storage regulator CsrA